MTHPRFIRQHELHNFLGQEKGKGRMMHTVSLDFFSFFLSFKFYDFYFKSHFEDIPLGKIGYSLFYYKQKNQL